MHAGTSARSIADTLGPTKQVRLQYSRVLPALAHRTHAARDREWPHAQFVDSVDRAVLSQAMPNTFKKRARDALQTQDGSFRPRGDRALSEVMKQEMLKDLDGDVARNKKRVDEAGREAMHRVENATAATVQKIEALAE